MAVRVVYAPEALTDLRNLYDVIADASLPQRALTSVVDLQLFCADLAIFPKRVRRHDALRPGLQVTSFRRRVTVAHHLAGAGGRTETIIDRLLHGGRDAEALLRED